MRGDNAGTPFYPQRPASPQPPQSATLRLTCRRCRCQFESDFEEELCPVCTEWAELYRSRR